VPGRGIGFTSEMLAPGIWPVTILAANLIPRLMAMQAGAEVVHRHTRRGEH